MTEHRNYRSLEVAQYLEFAPHLRTSDDVLSIIKSLDYIDKYAFIYHTDDNKGVHVHIMLHFTQPKTIRSVAKDFGVESQYVEKIKTTFNKALAYLTHANAPEKHQYSTKLVYTNILEIDKITESERKIDLNSIYSKIDSGEIREYNIHKYLTVHDYVRHKAQLDLAFQYYKRKNLSYDRKMAVIYIYGASESGKTTLAKKLLASLNKDFYVSSGGKNFLDDYLGQPAILLDDFRDDNLSHSDFLKLLDPFTSSAVGARFYNKMLYCDIVVITSTLSYDSLYTFIDEDKKQILRRLPIVLELHASDDKLDIFFYNSDLGYHHPAFESNLSRDDINGIISSIKPVIDKINNKEGF